MSAIVFTYGTLLKGECRHGISTFEKIIHEEAFLRGYKILDLGSFPGIVEAEPDNVVVGEIHRYSSLEELDMIEGYNERYPDMGLYARKTVTVEAAPSDHSEGGPVHATVYTLNNHREAWGTEVIESGDWRKRGEKSASVG